MVMKIKFIVLSILSTVVLFCSCTNASKDDGSIGTKQDFINLQNAMDSAFKCSTPLFIDLPLGYNSGMVKEEYLERKDNKKGLYLEQECEISVWDSELEAMEKGTFLNDILFVLKHNEDADLSDFLVKLKSEFDSTWLSFYFEYPCTDNRDMIAKNLLELHYYWIKDNVLVEYNRPFVKTSYMSFYDIPAFSATHNGYIQILSDLQKHFFPTEKKDAKASTKSNAVVENSPWDGSVYQVKRYVKKHLKDPSSYESVSWGTVRKVGNNYEVSHTYRARNSFGGYVVEGGVFVLNDKGQVIKYTPMR